MFFRRLLSIATIGMLALALSGSAHAADPVTIQVGYGAGGSYDMASRLVARHLGRFLPGNPEIIVQNVPGGGSIKLAQLLAGGLAADGSIVGGIGPGAALAPLLDPDNVDYDPLSFGWLASLGAVESFCAVSKTSGIETLGDFTSKEFLIGASGKSSTTYLFAALARNALGARFRIVTGFDGVADIELAIERGEIAGHCTFSYKDLVGRGLRDRLNVIARFGRADVKEYNSVPRVSEAVTDPLQRNAADLIESLRDYDFPFVLPAGASAQTIADMRKGFEAMMKDPDFLADARKTDEFNVDPTAGDKLELIVAARLKSDPTVIAAARDLVR
ncbi:MAG: hypothetical protein KF810_01970 [Rhizobiaceae bacterium]|nr:hypothetical protein [Rhizobiaceae bacterium]